MLLGIEHRPVVRVALDLDDPEQWLVLLDAEERREPPIGSDRGDARGAPGEADLAILLEEPIDRAVGIGRRARAAMPAGIASRAATAGTSLARMVRSIDSTRAAGGSDRRSPTSRGAGISSARSTCTPSRWLAAATASVTPRSTSSALVTFVVTRFTNVPTPWTRRTMPSVSRPWSASRIVARLTR